MSSLNNQTYYCSSAGQSRIELGVEYTFTSWFDSVVAVLFCYFLLYIRIQEKRRVRGGGANVWQGGQLMKNRTKPDRPQWPHPVYQQFPGYWSNLYTRRCYFLHIFLNFVHIQNGSLRICILMPGTFSVLYSLITHFSI